MSTSSADGALQAGLIALGNDLPFNQHLGAEVGSVQPGFCSARLRESPQLANHIGGVHAIAELAPVELAGALAASTRLAPLVERGFVPVLGSLTVRYVAPANGELTATATVPEDALVPALAAADEGRKPRAVATVEVTDVGGTTVAVAELTFIYLDTVTMGSA